MFEAKVVKIKTHILYTVFFFFLKSFCLWNNVKNIVQVGRLWMAI